MICNGRAFCICVHFCVENRAMLQHATIELASTVVQCSRHSVNYLFHARFTMSYVCSQNLCGFTAWNSIKILSQQPTLLKCFAVLLIFAWRVCKCGCRWFRPMSTERPQNNLIIHNGKSFKAQTQNKNCFLLLDADRCRDHNNGLPNWFISSHHIFFYRVSFVKIYVWPNCDHPNWMKKKFHGKQAEMIYSTCFFFVVRARAINIRKLAANWSIKLR